MRNYLVPVVDPASPKSPGSGCFHMIISFILTAVFFVPDNIPDQLRRRKTPLSRLILHPLVEIPRDVVIPDDHRLSDRRLSFVFHDVIVLPSDQ